MKTVNFIPTDETFTVTVNGETIGTWTREDAADTQFIFKVSDSQAIVALQNPFWGATLFSTDTIQISGETQSGTIREIISKLKGLVFFSTIQWSQLGNKFRFSIAEEDEVGVPQTKKL